MTTPAFLQAFSIVVGEEGGFDNDPEDPGNWSTGMIHQGHLGGTKYGISCAAYPSLNIQALTLAAAQQIYWDDYWTKSGCDRLDPPVAFIVFDASVNNGPNRSIKWLQTAIGTPADGNFGPASLAAYKRSVAHGAASVLIELVAQRIYFMGGLNSQWSHDGLGWSRRLAALPYHALKFSTGTDAVS